MTDSHPSPEDQEGAPKPAPVRWTWTPRRRLVGAMIALVVAVPVLLTLAGALTSPPHARSVPVGRLIYLEADEPSEHTSLLRGLRIMTPDGSSRQLLHETEPQDRDDGSREWITQPQASPDGRWLAYEDQIITIQEETHTIDNQLWVLPLTGPSPQPRMLLDLTKQHLKQFVGLAWTRDSRAVVFLDDTLQYSVGVPGGGVTRSPMPGTTVSHQSISTTRSPQFVVSQGRARLLYSTGVTPPRAVTPDGQAVAEVQTPQRPSGATIVIRQSAGAHGPPLTRHRLSARWGWSVFGGRHITALKWSPDGRYLAYSVSKPPFEDEVFYIDEATEKSYQLPVRTGSAGWDWAP